MKIFYNNFKAFLRSLSPSYYKSLDRHKVPIKYLISGGTVAMVDLGALYILTDFFKIHYLLSASLALMPAFFISFCLQKFWTFRDNGCEKIYRQIFLYFVVGATNLTVNAGCMYILVDKFGVMYMLAQVIIGPFIALSSFLIYRYIIFRKHKKELAMEEAGRKLKVLIATGIFPPDIGGPAKYAKNLAEEFLKRGHEVKVLAYKTEKKLPIGIRHCLYFFRVVFNLHKTDLIIALDTFSVGMPTVIAAKIFNKKIIIRTGGDFLWESYVERSGNLITLKQFYEVKPALNLKEKTIFILSKYVLKNSTAIVFSTGWQKEIFEKYYGLNHRKNYIIENYFETQESGDRDVKEKKFLWAGRPIKLKNMERLREAFSEAQKIRPELILNIVQDMPYEKLLEEIKKCYVVILPSLSEISPNFILDAISCRKPFILTKESGYREMFKSIGLFTDPLDKEDMKNKILFFADDKNYFEYRNKVINFNYKHTWQEIAKEFINIYKRL